MKNNVSIAALALSFFGPAVLFAAHPLITDDTGVQGKNNSQLESNFEYGIEKDNGTDFKSVIFNNILSFGYKENLDVIVSIPYMWSQDKKLNTKENGISDMSFELKYKFYEKNNISLALKPLVSIPLGNEKKGFGSGKIGYGGYIVVSGYYNKNQYHFNLGYIRNENKLNDEKDIYHLSIAGFIGVKDNLNIVWDVGSQTNTDIYADNNLVYMILGFIYSLKDNFDIDAGVKKALTEAETDWTYLFGLTWRW